MIEYTFKRLDMFASPSICSEQLSSVKTWGPLEILLISDWRDMPDYLLSHFTLTQSLGFLPALQPAVEADSYSSWVNCTGGIIDQRGFVHDKTPALIPHLF